LQRLTDAVVGQKPLTRGGKVRDATGETEAGNSRRKRKSKGATQRQKSHLLPEKKEEKGGVVSKSGNKENGKKSKLARPVSRKEGYLEEKE